MTAWYPRYLRKVYRHIIDQRINHILSDHPALVGTRGKRSENIPAATVTEPLYGMLPPSRTREGEAERLSGLRCACYCESKVHPHFCRMIKYTSSTIHRPSAFTSFSNPICFVSSPSAHQNGPYYDLKSPWRKDGGSEFGTYAYTQVSLNTWAPCWNASAWPSNFTDLKTAKWEFTLQTTLQFPPATAECFLSMECCC